MSRDFSDPPLKVSMKGLASMSSMKITMKGGDTVALMHNILMWIKLFTPYFQKIKVFQSIYRESPPAVIFLLLFEQQTSLWLFKGI